MEIPAETSPVEPSLLFLSRILKSQSPHHAYLFFGPPASAKEEKAFEFAKTLLCREKSEKPCGSCRSCLKIESGNHPDFRLILPEGEKIKISQIRWVKGEASYPPLESPWKIFLIHRCETLTEEAAQSMLVLLEEPPVKTILILTAPHPGSLLPTIVSRCHSIPFRPLILEKESFPEVPLAKAKEWADLIQAVAEPLFSEAENPMDLSDKVTLLEDYKEDGERLLHLLYAFYRDVMALKSGWEEGIVFHSFKKRLGELAFNLSWREIDERSEQILEASNHLRQSGNFRLVMENLLWKLQD